ncbi:MAG: DMT family transporter, partial [Cocleimonas sp.]
SSFIFMRASVDAFGPIALIAVRISVAALFLFLFLMKPSRRQEFIQNWKTLFIVGLTNSAIPFSFLAYSSLTLTGGTVSILNAMTPVFTAWIAHIWLKIHMTKLQYLGMLISLLGLIYLVSDKVELSIQSWLPVLAGVGATICYGISSNTTKKYLSNVSVMTSTAGSLFFSALLLLILSLFFLPDFNQISSTDWLYAIILGVLCTAIAFIIYFKLVKNIGPSKTASVTFLIPIFAFLWGYLLLDEVVTTKMWIATGIILLGMALVMEFIHKKHDD